MQACGGRAHANLAYDDDEEEEEEEEEGNRRGKEGLGVDLATIEVRREHWLGRSVVPCPMD